VSFVFFVARLFLVEGAQMRPLRTTLLLALLASATLARTPISDTARQKNEIQKTFLNKPVVLAGRTSTGGTFSTADLKGQVILVDFWAAWCPDCTADAPKLRALYEKYHDKGVAFVGVNCDKSDAACNDAAQKQKRTWTHLREDKEVTMHPLTEKFSVWGLPTVWLIDKHGTLRTLDGDTDPEKQLDALLAE
jgi:thiol-disulfide isomerase/thioredoxin